MTQMDSFEKDLARLNVAGVPGRPRPHTDAKVPLKDKVVSVLGFGAIPPTMVAKTSGMVAEGNRMDSVPAEELTSMEHVVRTPKVKVAEKILEDAAKGPVEKQVAGIKSMFARINLQKELIGTTEKLPVVGPHGTAMTFAEAQDSHDTLRDEVTRVTNEGSVEHLRPRRRSTFKEIGVMMLDYPVFLLAMMSLLNVNIRLIPAGDFYTVVMFATAIVFALLGTLLIASVMRTMGRRHRTFKGSDGAMHATGSTGRRIKIEVGVLAVVLLGAAVVMASRIYTDGKEAGAPPIMIGSLAILFAVLVGVSGYINYLSEYEDGSDKTDRLAHLGFQLFERTTLLHNLRAQLDALVEEAGLRIAELDRTLAKTEDKAVLIVTRSSADKAISLARSYHGDNTPLPEPTFHSAAFKDVKQQAAELATHHELLKSGQDA